MTTSIDTNVLVALWDVDDALHRAARAALDTALELERLAISGVVYAELLAAPGRTAIFLDKFCEDAGIGIEWELGERILRLAGEAFQGYATRRKKQRGTEPRRILADFLIGAHATVNEYKLLTMDAGVYRAGFPRLAVVEI
jgi:predicted nucleic acid-binding protein